MNATPTQNTTDDFLSNLQNDPLTTAAHFYAAGLPQSDKAVNFLADELGLSIEQAKEQTIGFSDRRLGKTLPSKDTAAGRQLREQLQAVTDRIDIAFSTEL